MSVSCLPFLFGFEGEGLRRWPGGHHVPSVSSLESLLCAYSLCWMVKGTQIPLIIKLKRDRAEELETVNEPVEV